MAKSVAGPKAFKEPWRPKVKSKKAKRGISLWRVVIVLAIAIAAGLWFGQWAQTFFNEGVDEVAGVRKKPEYPPHPASGPINFQ